MLEARNITVEYGSRTAIKNVSLSVTAGTIVAILGPNGAGKSTLIRALNGGKSLSFGEVLLDGRRIESFSRRAVARRIAVVAQESELRFPITVTEFVLGGRFASASVGTLGWESAEDLEMGRSALAETSLTEFASRYMNELSGGERQRAVLARALATRAQLLLLDEPTANLDLSHQASMLNVIRRRCRGNETAAVIVTHDLNLAAEFANEVLFLKSGEVLATGPTTEVMNENIIKDVFGIRTIVDRHPISGVPRVTAVHEVHA